MIELTIRIILSFFSLLILARVMGRKEISQMTFFNFVSAITIGTIGGALITDPNFSIWNGVYSLVGWSLLTLAMGVIDIKYQKSRKVIEGEPIVVINNGKIMEHALKKVRLDIDALKTMLREKDVFSIGDVDYAIFETDGNLSVLKKDSQLNPTKSDLNIQSNNRMNNIPTSVGVISDGVVNLKNLAELNLDMQWLEKQLHQEGIHSVSDIFYAEVQKDGTLFIDKQNDTVH